MFGFFIKGNRKVCKCGRPKYHLVRSVLMSAYICTCSRLQKVFLLQMWIEQHRMIVVRLYLFWSHKRSGKRPREWWKSTTMSVTFSVQKVAKSLTEWILTSFLSRLLPYATALMNLITCSSRGLGYCGFERVDISKSSNCFWCNFSLFAPTQSSSVFSPAVQVCLSVHHTP